MKIVMTIEDQRDGTVAVTVEGEHDFRSGATPGSRMFPLIEEAVRANFKQERSYFRPRKGARR